MPGVKYALRRDWLIWGCEGDSVLRAFVSFYQIRLHYPPTSWTLLCILILENR